MRRFVLAFVAVSFCSRPPRPRRLGRGRSTGPRGPALRSARDARTAPGTSGVDLAARARHARSAPAAAGVVVFAGTVARTRHVVVRHPGASAAATRSSPVCGSTEAERVRAGADSSARGAGARRRRLHLGLRIGRRLRRPHAAFCEPVDLPALVHLAPLDSDRVLRGHGFAYRRNRTFRPPGIRRSAATLEPVPRRNDPDPARNTSHKPARPRSQGGADGFVRSVLARAEAQPREARPWPS